MEWIKIIIGIAGVVFILCFLQGCSKMKAINSSSSYFLKGDKVVYSYKQSKLLMGENEVKGADIATFTPLNDFFAKDKNSVYWHSSKIEEADPDSFEFLPDSKYQGSFSDYYTKDKLHFFYKTKILKSVDADSFVIHGYNAKDKVYLYCKGKIFDRSERQICP